MEIVRAFKLIGCRSIWGMTKDNNFIEVHYHGPIFGIGIEKYIHSIVVYEDSAAYEEIEVRHFDRILHIVNKKIQQEI